MKHIILVMLTMVLMGLLAACTGGGGEATAVPATLSVPATSTAAAPATAGPAAYPVETAVPDTGMAYPALEATAVVGPSYPGPNDPDRLPPQSAPEGGSPETLAALADLVSQDLAQRLSLDVSQITVSSSEEVQWPDSSLGCPAPGYAYMQVITPGYKLTLQANGVPYEYHTDLNQHFVLCGQDGQPVP